MKTIKVVRHAHRYVYNDNIERGKINYKRRAEKLVATIRANKSPRDNISIWFGRNQIRDAGPDWSLHRYSKRLSSKHIYTFTVDEKRLRMFKRFFTKRRVCTELLKTKAFANVCVLLRNCYLHDRTNETSVFNLVYETKSFSGG